MERLLRAAGALLAQAVNTARQQSYHSTQSTPMTSAQRTKAKTQLLGRDFWFLPGGGRWSRYLHVQVRQSWGRNISSQCKPGCQSRAGLCTDSAVRHQQRNWISPAAPSLIRAWSQLPPNTPPYTPCSHREFTSIYANALWLTLLISFSLCSHYNSSLGRAVKCLKPGHWCSSYPPSVITTACDFIGTCSQKPSVSIVVQDSTTHLLCGPRVPYGAERKPSLPKKSTVRQHITGGFVKQNQISKRLWPEPLPVW